MCDYMQQYDDLDEYRKSEFFKLVDSGEYTRVPYRDALTFMVQNNEVECLFHYYNRRHWRIRWSDLSFGFEELAPGSQWTKAEVNGGETYYIPTFERPTQSKNNCEP